MCISCRAPPWLWKQGIAHSANTPGQSSWASSQKGTATPERVAWQDKDFFILVFPYTPHIFVFISSCLFSYT